MGTGYFRRKWVANCTTRNPRLSRGWALSPDPSWCLVCTEPSVFPAHGRGAPHSCCMVTKAPHAHGESSAPFRLKVSTCQRPIRVSKPALPNVSTSDDGDDGDGDSRTKRMDPHQFWKHSRQTMCSWPRQHNRAPAAAHQQLDETSVSRMTAGGEIIPTSGPPDKGRVGGSSKQQLLQQCKRIDEVTAQY